MKKKIMIVLQGMELPRSRVYHLSKALRMDGIVSVIVSRKYYKEEGYTFRNKELKEIVLPSLLKNIPIAFPREMLINFIVMPIIIILENPELVILSVPDGSPLLPVFHTCKALGKKLVIDIRDEWEKMFEKLGKIGFIIKKIIYCIYASANALTVVTPSFLKKYSIINANTHLIFSSANTQLFKPLNIKDIETIRRTLDLSLSDFIIVYSGKLSPPYRIDVILKSLKILKEKGDEDTKLLIFGRHGQEYGQKIDANDILLLAYKLGVEDKVKIMSFISQYKLAKYLGICNVGLIPYDDNPMWKKTIPIKFFEYCATGLPIIATTYYDSDLAYLINKYEIGITVDPLDHKRLAEAIFEMKSNKSLLDKMSVNARELVTTFFNSEKEYAKFVYIVKKNLKYKK